MNTPHKSYTIHIKHNFDAKSPADCDCQWKPYSFSNRHTNYVDPDTLQEDVYTDDENGDEQHETRLREDIADKLECGLAFWLDYSEHGNCKWSIATPGYNPDGILIWEHPETEIGATTPEARMLDAASFLEEYTDWCNGNCWGYVIESTGEDCPHCGQSPEPEDFDTCWGFIGDNITAGVADALQYLGISIDDCRMARSDMHCFDLDDIAQHIKPAKVTA